MKIEFETKALANAMNVLRPIAKGRKTHLILENVHMTIENEKVFILSTDWEFTVKAEIVNAVILDKKVESVLIPYNDLNKIVKSKIKTYVLEITDQNDNDTTFQISGISATGIKRNKKVTSYHSIDDFLEITFADKFDYPVCENFSDTMKKAQEYQATEKMRFALNGTHFIYNGNDLTMVSTDGKRLYCRETEISEKVEKFDCIIPSLKSWIKYMTDDCRIAFKEEKRDNEDDVTWITIDYPDNNFKIVTKAVNGQFPDYEKIIPAKKDGHSELTLDFVTKELISMIAELDTDAERQAVSISKEKGQKLILETGLNDKLEVETGNMAESFEKAGIQPCFLIAALKENPISVFQNPDVKPFVFTLNSEEIVLVMPVSL